MMLPNNYSGKVERYLELAVWERFVLQDMGGVAGNLFWVVLALFGLRSRRLYTQYWKSCTDSKSG